MNIHLINNISNRLTTDRVDKIVKDNQKITINLKINDIEDIFTEVSYMSFDNEKKYIVVKNLDFSSTKTKSDDLEKRLYNLVVNIPSNIVLILICDKIDSRKKIIKHIKENHEYIDFTIDYKNIYTFVNDYTKNNKYSLDNKSTNLLVKLYGLNIDLIFNELDKVFIYYNNPCKIDHEVLYNIISKPIDDNNFHFVDAVVNKDIKGAYKLLKDLTVLKVDPQALMILLAREFRLIYYLMIMQKNKVSSSDMNKTMGMQEWQINKIYKESLGYKDHEILSIIKDIAIYDEKIKLGKIDKNAAMNLLLLNIIT